MTQTASFQKLIHSAHVRSLTSNPLEFNLCRGDVDQKGVTPFEDVKEEWLWRNMDWEFARAINTCKQLGNCAVLFWFDKETGKYGVTNYSYEDGYQIVPNYDEYGNEIARSLIYQIDSKIVIDTYDSKLHYRVMQTDNGWEVQSEKHGFSRCPLVIKRGKVAWEYAESSIEMWELMANINAIALKRFGTFALVFVGEMDKDSFKIGEFNFGELKNTFKKTKSDSKPKKTTPQENIDDIPPAREKPPERKGLTSEEIEEIEYEQVKLENETIDDIFAEVEGIEDIPIISVDSKEEGKKE
jgi:hypothetical protein